MTEGQVCAVTAAGRAAFSEADAVAVRATVQSDLMAEKRSLNLKNADDQSVAGLLAVRDACRRQGVSATAMSEWGVVASPRTPGRSAIITALERYRSEGAWGVSPHVIPNFSLHSLAGLLSVALDIHGPNVGVGGISGGEGEAWLVASAWLAQGLISALWIVMTGWDGAVCKAVALALQSGVVAPSRAISFCTPSRRAKFVAPTFSLESLDRVLSLGDGVPLRSRWSLPGGATLEWRTRVAEEGRAAA
jgi:hypothetical protein